MNPFFRLAEELWRDWLQGSPTLGSRLAPLFALDACPEPYLDFSAGPNELLVLTTNPGAAMAHQRRRAILSGESPVRPDMEYRDVARIMADFYVKHLTGAAARRISAQRDLSMLAGFDGVLQVEACPWHSANLPAKSRFLDLLGSEPDLVRYSERLRDFLVPRPAVGLSAMSSRTTLDDASLSLPPWIEWEASMLGLDVAAADRVPLVRKGAKITSMALVSSERDVVKALVLTMGGNNFPGSAGRSTLAKALRRPF